MSDLNRPAPQSTVYFWRIVALTAVILFMMTTAAAIQLSRKLREAKSIVHLTRAEQERERKAHERDREWSQESRDRLMKQHQVLWQRLYGHSHGRHPLATYADDPAVAGESWGQTFSEHGENACSGAMNVLPALRRQQFQQWMFDFDRGRVKSVRFRCSLETHDSQGFLLHDPHKILTAEILPVLTNSDQVGFFLWVSSSTRPSDPFPRRLIPLGSVPRATAETESFILVDRLGRARPLRSGDAFPLVDVVRQSDGATVVSLNGYVENFDDPVEAPRPDV